MTIHQRQGRVPPSAVPPPDPQRPPSTGPPKDTDGPAFADHLEAAQRSSGDVEVSAHAKQRMRQRGISFTAAERQALSSALQQLDAQGARDAAVMRDDAAFVVNVPNRTVVTALDHSEMQHRVFTNIDSALKM